MNFISFSCSSMLDIYIIFQKKSLQKFSALEFYCIEYFCLIPIILYLTYLYNETKFSFIEKIDNRYTIFYINYTYRNYRRSCIYIFT